MTSYRLILLTFSYCLFVCFLFADEVDQTKFDPYLARHLKNLGLHPLPALYGSLEKTPYAENPGALDTLYFDVIVHGDPAVLERENIWINSSFPDFVTSRLSFAQLQSLAMNRDVSRIEQGPEFSLALDLSAASIGATGVWDGEIDGTSYTGKNVLIGIIDTGIDFEHPDFRGFQDQSMSRIVSLWDVTLTPQDAETPPAGYNYGVEYIREDVEMSIAGTGLQTVRSRDSNGHGSHVSGIAGGNGAGSMGLYSGIAPDADFIIVQVPGERISSSWIIDGLNYIFTRAEDLGLPAVVNISLGSNGGAHDGTSALEQAVDEYTRLGGRAVVVAAGNSGNNRIHYAATALPSSPVDFKLQIPGYQPAAGEGNDNVLVQLWFVSEGQARLTVSSPSGHAVSLASHDQTLDSILVDTDDGTIRIDTYSNFQNSRGGRIFEVYLYDGVDQNPPRSGDWSFRVQSEHTGDVGFNCWIVNSSMNNVVLSPHTGREYTVTVPGTADRAITVGSYITKNRWTDLSGINRSQGTTPGTISVFSGGGPTRDGRMKPEISAPGQVIASVESRYAQFPAAQRVLEPGYVILNGTSMATPHITGAIALMFDANPNLRRDDIVDILVQTADQDQQTGTVPNTTWGGGKVNALEAVRAARNFSFIPPTLELLQNYPNPFNAGTRIIFTLGDASLTTLTVYDLLGREVAVLVDEHLEARTYMHRFEPVGLSSGVYFYRLRSGNSAESRKMIIVR